MTGREKPTARIHRRIEWTSSSRLIHRAIREYRQRQDDRREHEEVGPLLAEAAGALRPVAEPRPESWKIAEPRRPDASVLEKQHAVPLRGQAST